MTNDLLKVQQERLKIALAWEKKKKIPNPETSSIIESIIKLQGHGKESQKESREATKEVKRFGS